MAKPSDEIRALYVLRLESQGIGDLDDADHETCMLARWDGLLEWLDAQQEHARVERELAKPAGERARGLGLDRLFANLQPGTVLDLASSGPARALGSDAAERARRACERSMVGKRVEFDLNGTTWVVRVVDHLASTADLVEASGPLLALEHQHPFALKHVPLVDVAGSAGCSCGQHVDGGSRRRCSVDSSFNGQERTALFLGHLTRSVLGKLPTARVEWAKAGDGVSVTVTWHEAPRPRSVADPARGGSYTKAFGAAVTLDGSIAETARREARLICKELTGG